jgi:hypothetical protein
MAVAYQKNEKTWGLVTSSTRCARFLVRRFRHLLVNPEGNEGKVTKARWQVMGRERMRKSERDDRDALEKSLACNYSTVSYYSPSPSHGTVLAFSFSSYRQFLLSSSLLLSAILAYLRDDDLSPMMSAGHNAFNDAVCRGLLLLTRSKNSRRHVASSA